MPDNDDNTISTTIKETSQSKDVKEKQEDSNDDLFQEMASAAISSMGEVLYRKYSRERLDGKPRSK
jgi:hypothetical protein